MRRDKKINLKRELRKKRARAKLLGDAKRPRASVFRSNKFLYIQLIDDSKGKTLVFSASKKGIKEATKLGEKVADLAKKVGIKSVVFDRSSYKYHGQVKTLVESLRTAGLKV